MLWARARKYRLKKNGEIGKRGASKGLRSEAVLPLHFLRELPGREGIL